MGLHRLAATWHALGTDDPLWAVLSHPDKRGGGWDLDAFLATGRVEIDAVLSRAVELQPALAFGRALDFGCGVGRLTQALATRFAEVHGVDIAPSMLDRASALDRSGGRCTFHLNPRSDLRLFGAGMFDFAYSSITLQHMRPKYALRYVGELLRVVHPGGLAMFQLAGAPRGGPFGWSHRVRRAGYLLWQRHLRRGAVMDMFGTAPAQVRAAVAAAGGRMLEVVENTSAGPDWTSFRYAAAPGAPR